jgi:hypothetical protein
MLYRKKDHILPLKNSITCIKPIVDVTFDKPYAFLTPQCVRFKDLVKESEMYDTTNLGIYYHAELDEGVVKFKIGLCNIPEGVEYES